MRIGDHLLDIYISKEGKIIFNEDVYIKAKHEYIEDAYTLANIKGHLPYFYEEDLMKIMSGIDGEPVRIVCRPKDKKKAKDMIVEAYREFQLIVVDEAVEKLKRFEESLKEIYSGGGGI